jgi:glutathione reductase (NADPH)
MTISKDLVVVGAGMAGITAANKCAAAGWQVAIIDELPYGGTCALRGCDPKKMLRRGAEIIDAANLMRGRGIAAGGLAIDWAGLMAHKRSFTDAVPAKMEAGLKSNGVETFHGRARFVNENTLELAGGERLQGRHILIATGASPRRLGFEGADLMIDSTAFLELEELPPRILFVGGGFISFELAHIAARAGSAVTILHHSQRMLRQFDPDLVALLVDRSRAIGIGITTGVEPQSLTAEDDGLVLATSGADGALTHAADLVVHGAGREAAIAHLDLPAGGIAATPRGVTVHSHLQSTSNPAVFAAGDAADSPGQPLTPVAVFEGKVAASNMLKGGTRAPDYTGVPSSVFTVPELVRVGLLEEEAKVQGLDFRVAYTDTSGWFSNRRIGETHAAAKVLIDNETGKVLGAHMFGPEYAELINFFGLAMRLGMTGRDLQAMVSAYPSVGSDVGSLLG